jgi:hypothetical protein
MHTGIGMRLERSPGWPWRRADRPVSAAISDLDLE